MAHRLAYTIKEVASMLGVSEKTIDNRLADGSLSFIRVGPKAVRITQGQLDDYFKSSANRRTG